MVKKICLSITYAIAFVCAIVLSSFALIKSFGIAYQPSNLKESTISIGGVDYKTTAQAVMLMEANSGRVIASKNEHTRLPMASLTKIITAIVAIQKNADIDTPLPVPKEAQGIEGSSIYLKAGEHLTIRQLLYGLMLRSGNDCATAIAILTSGSVVKFMEECNNYCKSLGLKDTSLVTPSGLHHPDHYTTASDLAIITADALKNSLFAEITSTTYKSIPNEKGKTPTRELKNKNKFLAMVKGADGVKTGYTTKAGRCFVGSVTRAEDNLKLVCVLLNCRPMFEECQTFTEATLKSYKMYKLIDGGYKSSINISGSKILSSIAKSEKDFSYPLTKDEFEKIEYRDTLSASYNAPLTKHQKVGEIKVLLDNQLIFCDNIYTIEDIPNNNIGGIIGRVIEEF